MKTDSASCDKLRSIGDDPSRIRNICILAHVDHGKTTIADSLLASNGLIPSIMTGKIRYLDSREDEQERGITLKSSAISLRHKKDGAEYLINLVDSPGHVDFTSEVSTAIRVCDGAVVVVDVVEGVRAQTIAVLHQAKREKLKMVVVLNKIDRLVTELKLTTQEAYCRLMQALENVNAALVEFSSRVDIIDQSDGSMDDNIVEEVFDPVDNNVVFTSAIGAWGFSLRQFADMFAAKYNVSADQLRKYLWGNYYIQKKTKKIKNGAKEKGLKPLFVSMILDTIWSVFDALENKEVEKLTKMAETLKIRFSARSVQDPDMASRTHAIFYEWLPLSRALLDAVVDHCPDPVRAVVTRMPGLISNQSFAQEETADNLDHHVVACISKFISTDQKCLVKFRDFDRKVPPRNKASSMTVKYTSSCEQPSSDDASRVINGTSEDISQTSTQGGPQSAPDISVPVTCLLGFTRLFKGSIERGQKLWILWPRHDPKKFARGKDVITCDTAECEVVMDELFLMMGREYYPVPSISAGNVFAFRLPDDLEVIAKAAILSSSLRCPPLLNRERASISLVNVALEPMRPGDIEKLREGVKRLSYSDSAVEIRHKNSGELILCTSGEIHLERCVKDLREIFCTAVDFCVSDPIVPFRETLIYDDEIPGHRHITSMLKDLTIRDENSLMTTDRSIVKVHAIPLPEAVIAVLSNHQDILSMKRHSVPSRELRELRRVLEESLAVTGIDVDQIICFGSRSAPCNMLINHDNRLHGSNCFFWRQADNTNSDGIDTGIDAVISGFQVAVSHGPLCEEPMYGVCIVLESLNELLDDNEDAHCDHDDGLLENDVADDSPSSSLAVSATRRYAEDAGRSIFTVKDSCRRAFAAWPSKRLVLAYYKCDIECSMDSVGRLYPIIYKRHGRVVYEDALSTGTLLISAVMPVVESFGFAAELWAKTSGVAMPQLMMSHWEVLDGDPLEGSVTSESNMVPLRRGNVASDDEEPDGETRNMAKAYLTSIRRRKGLRVNEVSIKYGEKQRTLARKK